MKKTFTFEIGASRQANHRFSSHLQPKVENSQSASDSMFAVMPLSEDSSLVDIPSNYLLDSPNEQGPSSEFYQLNIQQMNLFTYLTRAANNLFQLRGASNMSSATLLSKSCKMKSVLDLCASWGLSTLTNLLTSNKKEQLSASSLNGFSTLRTVFASLILTLLTAWTAVASPDLSLTATISNGNPNPGDLVTYIIKLKNSTGDKATNISVKDSLPSTLESIVYSSPASGVTYDNVNKKWVITQLLGNTEITLQVQARVKNGDLGRGIAYASFEVAAQTEPDTDSKPNNHNINEDDQAAVCFSVPTYFSIGSVFEVSAPKGLTNVVWTRRVGTSGVATAITATASGSGAYVQNGVLYVESVTDYTEFTFTATNSTCPVTGCCPVKFIPDPYGSIGDYVWSDVNANGIQDATETGLSGIKVDLYTSANTFVKTVTTTSTGYYLFDNLNSGTYQVRITLPTKSQITKANQGSDDTKDSDFSALGRSQFITINTTLAVTDTLRNNPNVDAGIVPLGSIGDYVFNDNNKDGIQNSGDTPVAGLKVSLLDKNGNVIGTTTTDASGKYEFIVASGQYYVLFDKPAGSTFTLTGRGTSSTDSDAGTDGKSLLITIDATRPVGDPARDNKDIDAGIIPSCNVTTGNLLASTSSLCLPTGGSLTLTASVSTAPTIPTGYIVRYLLSKGTTNVIVQTGTTPSFSVNAADSYKIHTIVYNTTDLNLTTAITLGTTKLSDLQTTISGKCLALDATGVGFNVTSNPDMPNVIASTSTLCAGDVTTLTASGTGSSYKWYTLPTGGTAFATTASVQVTPTTNTTYYVETVNTNGCTSARKSISIVVNPKPTTPTVLASLVNQCSPTVTTTVNLASAITSTPSTSGGVFEWRTGSTPSASLVANPAVVGAGTYYLFEKSTTGCYSAPAVVTVNITPCGCPNPASVIVAAIQSQCVGSFTQLQLSATLGGGATSGTWTTTGTGTFDNVSSVSAKYTPSSSDETKGSIEFTFTTNDPDGSATLCTASSSKTTFIYKARPSKPSNLSASSQVCLGQSNTLTAESAGNTIKWYTTATGGSSVGTGTSFTVTPTAAGTVMYYAEAVSPEGCISERASINFTANPSPTTPTVLASLANQCSPTVTTTVNLASAITSTPSTSGGVFEWRTGSTPSASLVANPAVVGAGTYYLFEKSTTGCYSAPAVVTVNITPCGCTNPASVIVAAIQSQCVGSFTQLQLSATLGGGATSGTWTTTGTGTFDNVSSVSAKYTPSAADVTKGSIEFTFTTNDPDGSATQCSAAVSKTIFTYKARPSAPTNLSANAICLGESTTLTADGGGNIIKWYTTATGGTSVGTGSSFNVTPTIAGTITCYAEAVTADGCTSERVAINFTVYPRPTTPTVLASLANQCSSVATTTVNLASAITSTPSTSGGVFEWRTGSTPSASLVANPAVVGAGTYYLFEKSTTGCYSAPAVVTVNITPCGCPNPASVIVAAIQSQCVGSFTQLQLSATLGGGATSGTWTTTGTGTFDNVSSVSAKYTPSSSDETKGSIEFTFTTNDPDGSATLCTASSSKTIFTYKARPSKPSNLSASSQVCLGQSNTLTAEGAGNTIKWYTTATGGSSVGTGTSFTVTPTAAGTVMYYAEAVSPEGCISERASINFTVTSCQTTDLAVVKTVTDVANTQTTLSYLVGQTINYSIVAKNLGGSGASTVKVKDVLPASLSFVSADPSAQYNASTGEWTIGDLAAGAQVTLNIKATILSKGSIVNDAEISSPSEDPTKLGNNKSSVSINAIELADLSLTKTVSNATPNINDEIVYTITVSNAGPHAATNVEIQDILPAGISFVSSTSLTNNNGTLTGTIANLAKDAKVEFTFRAKVTSGGKITNAAQITKSDVKDPDSTPNNGTDKNEDDDDSVDIITPTVCNVAAPALAADKAVICSGQSVNITALGCTGQIKWNTGETTASITVTPSVNATYTATCTVNNCTSNPSAPVSITVTTPTVPTIVASSTSICGSGSVTLTATGCTGTVKWYGGAQALTGTSVTVNPTVTTTYSATCTVSSCESTKSQTVTITVGTPTPPAISPALSAICSGSPLTLSATGCAGGTIEWSNGMTGSSITVTPTASTNYTAVCKMGTCTSTASNTANVTVSEFAKPTIVASKTSICVGESVQLTATGCNGTVKWSDGQTGASVTIKPSVTTSYTATCISTNATCNSGVSNTIEVKVNSGSIEAPIVVCGDQEICVGQEVVFLALGCPSGTTVKWSNGMTGSSITVKPTITTVYSAVCSLGACESVKSNEKEIVVKPTVVVTLVASADKNNVCAGSPVTLSVKGCEAGKVTWTGGLTGSTITVNPTVTTTYTALCTDVACATDAKASVTVNVATDLSTPVIVASTTSQICAGTEVTLTATGCTADLLWSTGETTQSIKVKPTVSTAYTVQCKSNSCASATAKTSDPVTITVGSSVAPLITASTNTVCAGTQVTLTTTGCTGTVTWSNGKTGASIIETPTTTTTYSATCSGGTCVSGESNKVTVTVTPLAIPTISVVCTCPAKFMCPGSSMTLVASGCEGGTYQWSDGFTGAIHTVSPTQTTNYTVKCVTSTCTSAVSAVTTITVGTPTAPVITSDVLTACAGSSVNLTATGCDGAVIWSDGQIGTTVSVKPTANTTYTAICKLDKCESGNSNELTINVGNSASKPSTKDLVNACPATTVDLTSGLLSTASNGSSFEFRTGISSTSTLVSNPQAVSATGTYYVFEKFASGCYSAPAAINVFINTDCSTKNCTTAPAAVNAGADATICDTKSYQLKGAFSGAATFITWKSTGTGTFDNPLLPTATYTASAQDVTSGSVKLFLISNDPDGTGACVAAVDTMVLTINGIKIKPTITVSGNLTACTTDSVGLKAIAGYQYKWYKVGSTSVVSTAQAINVKGLGSYYYILSDSNGCTSVPSDTATLNPLADISAPVTKNIMISSGQTANLNSLVTSTTPAGATLVFKAGGLATSNDIATSSAVGFGTYYAFYRTVQGCFSSGSPITVSTDLVVMDLADIGVGITTDKATYAVGDTVVTTVKVVNSGPRTAKGVALSVIIPGTLTYASQTGGLIQNGNTIGVNIDTLVMNGSKTYTFKSVVTSTSEATITVSATSATVDPNTANNKASVTINAGVVDPNAADAAIAIVADKTAIGLNETTTIKVTVSNNGPATAKGVKVTTTIPTGFELLSAEPSWVVNGNTLTANYDSLQKGDTKVLTFIAKGITSGNLLFGATVASTLDPKTDNNTATTTIQVGTINPTDLADLALSFTTDKSIVSKGDEVVYTLKVQNNGPATASNIELRALFPQGLTFLSGDVDKTTDSVKATISSLAVGASKSFSYRVKVDEDRTISTTATTTKYSPTDPLLTNNTATATIVSTNDTLYADLSVIKTASATTVNKDSLVTYIIKVTNAGPANAKNVVLKDFLVSNLSYISGDFTSTGKTATGDSLSATIASIAKGETKSLTYNARAVLQGVAPNTVFVASSSKLDAVKDNDKSTVEVNIINRVVNDCKLGLALAVIDTNQTSAGVYNVTYQLIAKNFCSDTLRNVSLVDSVAKNFPSPATFSISAVQATGHLTVNEAFGASDPNLVKSASSFMIPNEVDTVRYTVTLTLNGNKGPFYSQVNGSGIAPSGTVTAKSAAGTDVSATPSRTVVRFDLPRTLIGVAKEVLASGLKRESTNEWTVPYVIRVVNMGVNRITKLSVTDDLDAVYTSKGATIVGQPTVSTNRPGVKVNSKYTGSGLNIDLVLPDSSALGVGDSVSINLAVRVNTTAATDSVFSNVAIGKGTGTDGLTYEDISTAGSDPDPDKDGDPSNNKVATSVTLSNPVKPLGDAAIGVALSASKPVMQTDSTFNVKFKLVARNYGKDTLNNVVLANHIQSNIGQQVTAWSLVGKPTLVSGKVKLDSLFDGIADTTLTVASSTFKFAKGDSIVIEYTLNIREPLQDTIYTQASATGISIADATKIAFDLSTAGANPDPNGDGNPAENAKTPVIFDASVVTDSPFIPEGFSPNGDGINDKFVIQPLNPDQRIELKIFNRWGSLVYASSDYQNDWGGESNQGVKVIGDGQGLPDGSYFYSFTRYDRTTGEIIQTQGKTTVVRYFTIAR